MLGPDELGPLLEYLKWETPQSQLDELFEQIDFNKDGKIEFKELAKFLDKFVWYKGSWQNYNTWMNLK